ncbi:hypothetical protein E4U42_005147 [Claviceps africana]|uniref:Cyanovirin-N domain-containing protein n=1 Tax=Claviceps africana TaxID=83212 RepID=A0A8K0NK97_9HYPO|nr:hypothetical protein E4U42_005147 [Claviceps africana]
MSFAASSQDIRLEGKHMLHALCRDTDGNLQESSIDLNKFLGNQNGYFIWGGENFSETADQVELEGYILSAVMRAEDGQYAPRQIIDLNERITNDNGRLVFE